MNDFRDEVLVACHAELKSVGQGDEVLGTVRDFYDELLRALRRDSGAPDQSSLPGSSESAAKLGRERQRAGVSPAKIPEVFGAISQAVAKTGERYDLTISAEEYALLNKCFDVGIAISIENYWQRDHSSAERASETLGYLAHELRNALGNADMSWKLVRSGNVGFQGRTADVLDRSLLRMRMLIAQCLSNARTEAGQPVPLVALNVASVLRELESSMIPDRGVQVVLNAEEVYIAADEMLLSSALGNLLHNAVKFSRVDGVVTLTAHAEADVVFIRVDDACGGLNRSNLEELFEPFVTERPSAQKGIGLGLAITKSAVKAMNGELSLVDRPGVGCTFVLCFPAWRSE